jgi:methylthioxylose transferase
MTSGGRGPGIGLALALGLVVLAITVPRILGWEVWARSSGGGVPPLHGFWNPTVVGPGTVLALVIAVLSWRYAVDLAERLSWRRLLVASYVAGLAWLVALAMVDGTSGLTRTMEHGYDYLHTARGVTDVGAMIDGFAARIPARHPDNWTVHVAGHPPGALLVFVGLVRIGLGGSLAAGLAVTVLAASTAPAVLQSLRTLGAEAPARRAAPFVVLGPAALFLAVSADALFGAIAAWGLAALAVAATRTSRWWGAAWSVVAGMVLGCCVMLSYGLPLLGLLAMAVLAVAGSWRPLPVAAVAAVAVVLAFASLGYTWWEAFPVLRERYWDGLAKDRPATYWLWGNLAALVLTAGPVLGAGLGRLAELRERADRAVRWLVLGAAAAVVVADLSLMSKAEVERIWLPFVPWLLLSAALLPDRWRRPALALQLVTALVMQHLLYTSW